MASSFTTHLGIEEMATGEKSGTWGTISNFNWDIMDRIATYKAVAITTNADTATLTVREASPGTGTENLQDGMYRVIKFTGALDSNCTVTIAPNTTQVFFIVVNATTDSGSSGPYSVILSQGSGANITVENGKSAVVYCDGAGGGAAVIDALSNLQLATVTASSTITASGDITSSGTLNALGDTSASDKAAIGYTSAEGLIITGQGSTNDVTIKNDADADVLEIPTGTTNVTVVGDITAAGTVGATGDTAAGDDAAIGYTSAEGIIITGQGSTSDITIKNDADADVLTVATGTTNVDIVGDVTASTVNADGDTSAGDDAAMGYTSAEGLILTGQGSTNDVTIKNDADADVLTIATGATNVDIVGDVTAATINADGDTSASDNAAMGYTAAEGLILTGQGSTSDITFKNDADANVFSIPTGTSILRLSDATTVDMSTPLLAGTDHTFTGITAQMLAGGAISAFDLVCIHTTTSEVLEADASAYATARVIGIAPAAISDTATGTILLHGFIRDDSWSWTTGSTLYLSETAGAMTHTAPSTDGAFVLVVGVALSPDVVYINPSMDVIERA
jgi:hypothetical protein